MLRSYLDQFRPDYVRRQHRIAHDQWAKVVVPQGFTLAERMKLAMTRGKYESKDRGAHNWRTWLAVVILATLIGFGCAIGVDLADAVTGISW